MERHFAALRIPDSETDQSLNRTRSVSELPAARRIVLEQTYKSGNTTDLVRQYSCEEIFDVHANIRQLKIAEVVTSRNIEHKNVWSSIVPHFGTQNESDWTSHEEVNKNEVNQIEEMEIDVSPQKCQIFPSKPLPLCKKTLKEPEVPNTPLYELHIKNNTSVQEENKEENILCKVSEKENNKLRKDTDSNNQHLNREYQDLKKKFRPLVQPKLKSDMVIISSFCNCWKFIFLILLPIAVLMTAIMFNQEEFGVDSSCKQSKYYGNASVDLLKKIYGQEQAVSKLVLFLEKKNSCKKIVALVGGTGVGKSYTGEIIFKNFPVQYNVFHYYSPLKHKINNARLSKSACNLIILENLKEADLKDAAIFSSKIEGLEGYCSTIFMIFNMQETDENLKRKINLTRDTEMIKNAFDSQGLNVEVIAYEKLNELALERCIKDAAKESNIGLSSDDIRDIMKTLQSADSGCKGAYSKVQIIRRAEV